MNSLDSRVLFYGDVFAQKFSRPGRATYSVNSGASALFSQGENFNIVVKGGSGKGDPRQHDILVRFRDRHLVADPAELEIDVGDIVLWSAAEPKVPAFAIAGEFEHGPFSSAAMTGGALYSHPFGLAGPYDWEDANGNGVSGTVTVIEPQAGKASDLNTYQKKLATGVVMTIHGKEVKPKSVEIFTGQRVFWAIEKAEGITITDRRLKVEQPILERPLVAAVETMAGVRVRKATGTEGD